MYILIQGNLVNGEYCGKGEYRFSDGSKYQGMFTSNMYVVQLVMGCILCMHYSRMTGSSEFTDSEGRVWIGTFNGRKAKGLTLKLS